MISEPLQEWLPHPLERVLLAEVHLGFELSKDQDGSGTSQVTQVIKNLPANAGDIRDMGLIPGWEDPLEKEMATHSSILT